MYITKFLFLLNVLLLLFSFFVDHKKLKIATIFSFVANYNPDENAKGSTPNESFEVTAMNNNDKTFLEKAVADYNAMFKTNYALDNKGFQDYYYNLSKRVRDGDIDLLIVVGMFLTGFDAPKLNTLFVDKN